MSSTNSLERERERERKKERKRKRVREGKESDERERESVSEIMSWQLPHKAANTTIQLPHTHTHTHTHSTACTGSRIMPKGKDRLSKLRCSQYTHHNVISEVALY